MGCRLCSVKLIELMAGALIIIQVWKEENSAN